MGTLATWLTTAKKCSSSESNLYNQMHSADDRNSQPGDGLPLPSASSGCPPPELRIRYGGLRLELEAVGLGWVLQQHQETVKISPR